MGCLAAATAHNLGSSSKEVRSLEDGNGCRERDSKRPHLIKNSMRSLLENASNGCKLLDYRINKVCEEKC